MDGKLRLEKSKIETKTRRARVEEKKRKGKNIEERETNKKKIIKTPTKQFNESLGTI